VPPLIPPALIAKRVKKLRAKQGLSQADLAGEAKFSLVYASKLEQGQRKSHHPGAGADRSSAQLLGEFKRRGGR